jgi:voltage-gated hydrogen channel 1
MSESEQQPLLDPEIGRPDDVNSKQHVFRERLAAGLESAPVHRLLIALVSPRSVHVNIDNSNEQQILLDTGCVLADLAYTLLSPGCTPSGPDAPKWLEVLSHISLAITTLFLIEIPLNLLALGWSHFNPCGNVQHASLHLFDAIIIIVTFVLEMVLRGKERELAGLLIVLRLWRLVKLVGGQYYPV